MIESLEQITIPTPKECDPSTHFVIENSHSQTTIGLNIILQCLRIAELQADIPPLPDEWWYPLIKRHNIKMEINENIQVKGQ